MRVRLRILFAATVAAAGLGCVNTKAGTAAVAGGGWSDAPTQPLAAPTPAAETRDLPAKSAAVLSLSMAEALEKDGKDADAVAYYERARQLDPALTDRAARRLAVLYDRTDNQAQALTEFQELLKKKPKDASLLNDLGYSYYNRGQWAEAEAHLRRAVAAEKGNKRAWVNLGLALAQQGKDQDGLEAFLHAVSPAEAHANLGFVLASRGMKPEAVAEYRRALELEPTLQPARTAVEKLERPQSTPVVLPVSADE